MPTKKPKTKPRAAAGGGAGRPRGLGFPSQQSAQRPTHLVVFRRPSENNVGVLEKVLGAKSTGSASALASCTLFEGARGEAAQTRLYTRIGVATANLDDRERTTLEARDDVALVVENMERTLPPTPEARSEWIPGLTPRSANLPAMTPIQAYLSGMRDAADLALRFCQEGPPAELEGAPGTLAAPLTGFSWGLRAMGITPGYCRATGKGVRVAVLDTGVDLDHPDFGGAFIEDVNAVSFVPGERVVDGHGHGTHCAGVIGASAQPRAGGRYSVAPDCELLVGKVLSDRGRGYDDQIIDGIEWSVEQGAQIISMSLGTARGAGQPHTQVYETLAETFHEAGVEVLFVAAAGNESNRPHYRSAVGNPAACPSFMSVAAVDEWSRVAYFSCAQLDHTGALNISGPGVAIRSAVTGGGYQSKSGTSMAAPHVAGAAALYLEVNPQLSWRQLWDQLVGSARPLGDASDFGAGLVQAP